MRESYTIGELVKQGKMVKGDFIDYVPDMATYETNPENTGYKSQRLNNDKKVNWKVVYVDKKTGEVLIMPFKNLVEDVWLNGIIGYMNGPKELDIIASSLGSNRKLGAIAKCPTIEDFNKMMGVTTLHQEVNRYAFYPPWCQVYRTERFNGHIYERKTLSFKNVRFYTYDGGGKEKVDENGLKYRVATPDRPVFVTENTYCYHDINSLNLNDTFFWLASSCVGLCSSDAYYCVYYANSIGVTLGYMKYASGYVNRIGMGIRPLVSLNPMIKIDTRDSSRIGTYPEFAWQFASENNMKCEIVTRLPVGKIVEIRELYDGSWEVIQETE